MRWKLEKRHSIISYREQPLRFSLSEKIGMHLEGVYEGELESLMLADSALAEHIDKAKGAEKFLIEFLANGACRSEYVLRAAKARGISTRTLTRARKKLGIRSEKRSDGWYTVPPET